MPRRSFTKNARVLFGYLAANVREGRLKAGLTQERLAESVAVDVRFIQLIEAGETNVGIAIVADIAHAIGKAPGDLLTEAPPLDRKRGRPRRT